MSATSDFGAAELRAENLTRPMTRPGALGAAWRATGLRDVAEAPLQVRMAFAAFEDFWDPLTGKEGPTAAYVWTVKGVAP